MNEGSTKTLFLIGAIDRYNLGDLLFPVLLQRLWAGIPGCRFVPIGLRNSDYSDIGALPTDALRRLRASPVTARQARVILVGGEILTARWFLMLRYLLPRGLWIPARVLERALPRRWLERSSRSLLGGRSELPFVLDADDFDTPLMTAYNAVGGSGFGEMPRAEQRRAADKLARAVYLSVRDAPTRQALERVGLKPLLTPDIGILVADAYPAVEVRQRPAVVELEQRFPDGYLCFQSARYLADGSLDLIAEQLRSIARQMHLGIVLLPIGRAAEHEDQVGLAGLQRRLPKARLCSHRHLVDLLAVIAAARVFAGTSLHGNIAAMAYDVPHLGLTTQVPKLRAYLDTWSSPPFNCCREFHELSLSVTEALNAPPSILHQSRDQQLATARTHLRNMADRLGLQETAP